MRSKAKPVRYASGICTCGDAQDGEVQGGDVQGGEVQGAVAGSVSPAEIPSVSSSSDGGAAISDGQISANLRAFNNDHRYCKIAAASTMANSLGDDEEEMRSVASNATSGSPRSSVTWSEVRASTSAQVTVNSPSPIDSLSRPTAAREGNGGVPSISRQVSDNAAAPRVAAMVVGIERLSCTQCGKSYEHKVRLENHFISHTLEKHACTTCSDVLAQLLRCKDSKPYVCSWCHRAFGRKHHLKIHELRLHAVVRPYVCTRCNREFARRDDLASHERRHIAADRKRQLAASSSAAEHR